VELADWQRWWEQEGQRGLSVLLLREWNPIGFDDLPDDEYSAYAGPLARMLREGASEADIAAYLGTMRTKNIEMGPDPDGDLRAATRAVAWYTEAMRRAS
jgi:hypothetical protein